MPPFTFRLKMIEINIGSLQLNIGCDERFGDLRMALDKNEQKLGKDDLAQARGVELIEGKRRGRKHFFWPNDNSGKR